MKLDNDGTTDESILVRRRPKNLEFLDLDAKIGKSGMEDVKTLDNNEPTILDFKECNFSLIDCISLLQSVLILLMLIVKIKLLLNISLML